MTVVRNLGVVAVEDFDLFYIQYVYMDFLSSEMW